MVYICIMTTKMKGGTVGGGEGGGGAGGRGGKDGRLEF